MLHTEKLPMVKPKYKVVQYDNITNSSVKVDNESKLELANGTSNPVLNNELCGVYRLNGSHCDIMEPLLTHWGRVTHICVGNLAIIGSDNGLSPGRRQAII